MFYSPCPFESSLIEQIDHCTCLQGAASKLPDDKPATLQDAKGVTDAEMRNDRYQTTHPTGVAASVAAAARLAT